MRYAKINAVNFFGNFYLKFQDISKQKRKRKRNRQVLARRGRTKARDFAVSFEIFWTSDFGETSSFSANLQRHRSFHDYSSETITELVGRSTRVIIR